MQRHPGMKAMIQKYQGGRIGVPILLWLAGVPLGIVALLWLFFFRG